MFAMKGWMKAALFILGTLAVGLGMYATFQTDEAYGHHNASFTHDTDTEIDERQYYSKSTKKKVTCTMCNTVKREQEKTVKKYRIYEITKHIHILYDGTRKVMFSSSKYIGIKTVTTWSWTGACPNSQCPSHSN